MEITNFVLASANRVYRKRMIKESRREKSKNAEQKLGSMVTGMGTDGATSDTDH